MYNHIYKYITCKICNHAVITTCNIKIRVLVHMSINKLEYGNFVVSLVSKKVLLPSDISFFFSELSHVVYLTKVALFTHCSLLSPGGMSKSYQQQSIHNKSFSVLPDIVANYKTTMCNPYEKRKVTTNRSKIPVPKTSTSRKCAVRGTGLPTGLFGPAKTGLANFRIPKLNRSNNTSSTSHSRNKTPFKPMTDKSSRKPTTYLPKVSQPTKRGPHTTTTTTTTNPKRKVIAATSLTTNRAQRVQQRKGGPWPYGIPPCSRYTVKWGDPAYTGSYVEGEWCYDVVGAAPKPMGWPDMSDMFPDIPKGIFELRSAEPYAVLPELSSTEGTKKIQMIAFHLVFSLAMEVEQ